MQTVFQVLKMLGCLGMFLFALSFDGSFSLGAIAIPVMFLALAHGKKFSPWMLERINRMLDAVQKAYDVMNENLAALTLENINISEAKLSVMAVQK